MTEYNYLEEFHKAAMTDKPAETWPAFEQALAEFNHKHGVDWTSRELQDNTVFDIATRAYEIDRPTYCFEHGCYFAECGKLGHGDEFNPKETL